MPKVKESRGELLRRCARDDRDFTSDGTILYCKPCNKEVSVNRYYAFTQHKETALHQRNTLKNHVEKKQALISPFYNKDSQLKNDEFYSRVCKAFVSANIPLFKLEHAEMRALFKDYAGRELPHESTLRKNYVCSEYEKVIDRIRDDIGDLPIWLSIDETTDSCGRYMANVIVGKLSSDEPGKGHLILCRELEVANHATIVRTVQAALRLLWPTFEEMDQSENKVLALVSDAAPYMVKAGRGLKVLYPKMIHVTCLAHAVHRVAEAVREHSPGANQIISTVKKIFLKAPSRVLSYKTMHPELPLPPEPILTRWGTWVQAALFYADHYEAIKEVIETFDEADSKFIAKAKAALMDEAAISSLAFIKANLSSLPELILNLEASGKELTEVVKLMEDALKKAGNWPGKTGKFSTERYALLEHIIVLI